MYYRLTQAQPNDRKKMNERKKERIKKVYAKERIDAAYIRND